MVLEHLYSDGYKSLRVAYTAFRIWLGFRVVSIGRLCLGAVENGVRWHKYLVCRRPSVDGLDGTANKTDLNPYYTSEVRLHSYSMWRAILQRMEHKEPPHSCSTGL